MQYVGRFMSTVYNTITPNINPATLSGAIDVIVVERQVEKEVDEEDDSGRKKKMLVTELASTPFHVRFGKMSVLRPAERKVTLHLNNSPDPLPFAMKVGEAGEAFFVLELDDDEASQGIPAELVTSPILSASSSPALVGENRQHGHSNSDPGVDLTDNHRPPRKLIDEDFVEPLELGAPRAPSSQAFHSEVEESETGTVRSGETRQSDETGVTSPSLKSAADERDKPHDEGEADLNVDGERKSTDQHSSVLDNVANAASKASGVLGAAGKSITSAAAGGRNTKLERLVRKEERKGRHFDGVETGAEVDDGEAAGGYEPQEQSRAKERLRSEETRHPAEHVNGAKAQTEELEVNMRDRAETLIDSTIEARNDVAASEGAKDHPATSDRSSPTVRHHDEEAYPAPFGGDESKSNHRTQPTTQPDHELFLDGKALQHVDSGIPGRGPVEPAAVDARVIAGRLSEHKKEKELSGNSDEEHTRHDDEEQGHDADSVPTLKASRKEALQYMLDMDGYKMTDDGEDVAFAEGSRLAEGLPISKRHGIRNANDDANVSLPSQTQRRGSFGDLEGKSSNTAVEPQARRRGSHTGTENDSHEDEKLFLGLRQASELAGVVDQKSNASQDTDEVNLSRDLVRLTRTLRSSGQGDEAARTALRRKAPRRSHYQDTSLSDTEAEAYDESWRSKKLPSSGAPEQSALTHNRATSADFPMHRFGDEGPPAIRDDAALGRSDSDYEWGWGQVPKERGSAHRRQRVQSSTELGVDVDEQSDDGGLVGNLYPDEVDPYTFRLELGSSSHTFELSLCYVDAHEDSAANDDQEGHSQNRNTDWANRFEENKVSFQRFIDDASVVNDERLVVRYHDRLLTWENASTVLATLSLYRRTLAMTMEKGGQGEKQGAGQDQPSSMWRRWWNRSSKEQSDPELDMIERPSAAMLGRTQTDSVLDTHRLVNATDMHDDERRIPQRAKTDLSKPTKTYAKTLRLTSDQLKSLNLRKGANTVTFSVTSSYSGVATCAARIFLWDSTHQIVVSDIDGTITKSDALGHVFTMIGRDWTHSGVAKLYTDIARNGYRIMYLTSRAIGQADTTRDYLRGIIQNNYRLPDGPVIMSPDRLMASLHREVILRKPEVFKMACLRDIARLFGADPRTAAAQPGISLPDLPKETMESVYKSKAGKEESPADGAATNGDESTYHNAQPTPFYAGFGNRITDALSYRSVNIPSSRIFTIDSNGEVKMELLELAGYKSSYIHMTDLVDQMFPPITAKTVQGNTGKPEFNDFNYWRSELGEFELPPDDELIHTPIASSPTSPALSARSVRSTNSLRSSASTTKLREDSTGGKDADDNNSGTSRLSRFGLGKLGLSRRGSTQTVAAPSPAAEKPPGPAWSATEPPATAVSPSGSFLVGTSPPSSPSSYGSGVTSWTAGWRRRAASPSAQSASGVQATSPLVGPVITAEPEDVDEGDEGEEDDDVSSFGDEDRSDDGGDEGDDREAEREADPQTQAQQRRRRQADNMGDDVLDDDDPLLATGEIRFEWRG